jgi:hypothetical protein
LKSVNLKSLDILVSFDISLFAGVPVNEALQTIRNNLHNNYALVEWSALQPEAIMEMLEACLRTTYFQVNKFFLQKAGMAIGNSVIDMEHFENLVLDSALHKPSLWLHSVDDTFVVWPHGPEQLQNFHSHLNSLKPTIQFTMGIESDNVIPFLDVVVIRKETTLTAEVYRKSTHTGWYLSFNSNHQPHVKRGLVQSLHELLPYAKNAKIWIMKLVASDMIFSCTVIPEVSLTQLLTQRAAIIQKKRLNLWVLCISQM